MDGKDGADSTFSTTTTSTSPLLRVLSVHPVKKAHTVEDSMFHSCRLMRHRGAPLISQLPWSFAPCPPAKDLLTCAAREGKNKRRSEGKHTEGAEACEPSSVINI